MRIVQRSILILFHGLDTKIYHMFVTDLLKINCIHNIYTILSVYRRYNFPFKY